jgi:hypothetical protein
MIADHFCVFPDETTALAALPAYHYNNGNWDTSRVMPNMRIITADAVWDNSDPLKPVLVTPETVLPGWWIAISDKTGTVNAVKDIPGNACRVILDRDKAQTETDRTKLVLYISSAADPSVLNNARINPVFAGAPYAKSSTAQQALKADFVQSATPMIA